MLVTTMMVMMMMGRRGRVSLQMAGDDRGEEASKKGG